MFKMLSSSRIVLVLATTTLVTSALVWAYNPVAGGAPYSPVKWDERASQELTHEFHALHEASNRGDFATVKKLVAGDDRLVTFELDNAQTPVPLRSKKDIDSFLDRIVSEASNDRGTYRLEMPKMNCRATETFGVCTEECTIHYTVDGVERVDRYFGSGAAVKYPDGWKWIQYHMSVAAPSETVKNKAGE